SPTPTASDLRPPPRPQWAHCVGLAVISTEKTSYSSPATALPSSISLRFMSVSCDWVSFTRDRHEPQADARRQRGSGAAVRGLLGGDDRQPDAVRPLWAGGGTEIGSGRCRG